MDKNIFTLRNLDVDDIKAIELALGLEPKTIPIGDIPFNAVRKQYMWVKVGYFDTNTSGKRLMTFKQFLAAQEKGGKK